jgi:hypothetical protein
MRAILGVIGGRFLRCALARRRRLLAWRRVLAELGIDRHRVLRLAVRVREFGEIEQQFGTRRRDLVGRLRAQPEADCASSQA